MNETVIVVRILAARFLASIASYERGEGRDHLDDAAAIARTIVLVDRAWRLSLDPFLRSVGALAVIGPTTTSLQAVRRASFVASQTLRPMVPR
jgi:hypothetical protein